MSQVEQIIYGCAATGAVSINGIEIDISRSLAIENKAPSGFAWGYYGSGAGQLALAILLELSDEMTARSFYNRFKEDIISGFPIHEDLVLPVKTVKTWIRAKKSLAHGQGVGKPGFEGL